MKITLQKDGFIYEIKPFFNMAFLFAPMTFILMNMFYSFILYLIILIVLNIYNLLVLWLVFNVLLYFIGGYLRIVYLSFKGYKLLDDASENEKRLYKKIMRGR